FHVTGVQTCALPISPSAACRPPAERGGSLALPPLGAPLSGLAERARNRWFGDSARKSQVVDIQRVARVGPSARAVPPGGCAASRSEERRVGKECGSG